MDLYLYNQWDSSSTISELFIKQGDQALDYGHYQKAKEYYQQALRFNEAPKLYHNLGVVYMNLDCYEQGLESFGKALELQFHLKTLKQYLYAAELLGNYELLEHQLYFYQEAWDAPLWFLNGKVCERREENEGALAAYEHVLRLDHHYYEVYPRLINVCHRLEIEEVALDYIGRLKEKKPMAYLIYLAYYEEVKENYQKAIDLLEKAHTKSQEREKAMARLYEKQSNWSKALEMLELASEKEKDDYTTYKIGQLHRKTGQRKKYEAILDQMIKTWINDYRIQRT